MSPKTPDLRTRAFVLRRTNYGETDRILNLLTPEGKFSVLARGVRREKSRLAGGIELFSLSEVTIHQGKTDLAILTSAKMLQHFTGITADLAKLTLASEALKYISRAVEYTPSPEYFSILHQVLAALDYDGPSPTNGHTIEFIETWFWLNYARVRGEELNLYYDASGHKLQPSGTYAWDSTENALRLDPHGNITASHIKFMRLLLSNPLALSSRVKDLPNLLPPVAYIAKALNQL